MKTKCYCIFCKHHPLYEDRNTFKDWLTGWEPGDLISFEFNAQGKEVNCLQPLSNTFDELGKEPEDFEYPITAYGDGVAETGVEGNGFTIFAICRNERYNEN